MVFVLDLRMIRYRPKSVSGFRISTNLGSLWERSSWPPPKTSLSSNAKTGEGRAPDRRAKPYRIFKQLWIDLLLRRPATLGGEIKW